MLNSKQRATLRGMAQTISPILQIGKNGISDNFISDVKTALECHELIKISVLPNSLIEPKLAMNALVEETGAEPVSVIGYKLVLYKKSSKDNFDHIKF